MGRGHRQIAKSCAAKARFDTEATALAYAEYRFRAYRCPLCHCWHLTSRGGPIPPPAPPAPAGPLARVEDLVGPDAIPRLPEVPPGTRLASVVRPPDATGRVPIRIDGVALLTAPAPKRLRGRIRPGVMLRVSYHEPPEVVGLMLAS